MNKSLFQYLLLNFENNKYMVKKINSGAGKEKGVLIPLEAEDAILLLVFSDGTIAKCNTKDLFLLKEYQIYETNINSNELLLHFIVPEECLIGCISEKYIEIKQTERLQISCVNDIKKEILFEASAVENYFILPYDSIYEQYINHSTILNNLPKDIQQSLNNYGVIIEN